MSNDMKENLNTKITLASVRPVFFDLCFFALALVVLIQPVGSCYYFFRYMHAVNPVVFFLGGALLSVLCVRKNRGVPLSNLLENNKPIAVFILFGIMLGISIIINYPGSISFITTDNNFEGTFTHLSYIIWFFMGAALNNEKLRTLFIRLFVVSAAVISVVYIWRSLNQTEIVNSISIFYNQNHIGYFLTLCIIVTALWSIFAETLSERIGTLLVFSLGVIALCFNNTLGCQIAVAVGLVFTFFVVLVCRGKVCLKFLLPVGLAILIFVISVAVPFNGTGHAAGNAEEIVNDITALSTGFEGADDQLGSGRLGIWKNGIKFAKEKPVFGWGLDESYHLPIKPDDASMTRVHNEYLQYALDFGIPAMILYILGILAVFIRALRHRKDLSDINIVALCAAFAYFVSAFFGISLYYIIPLVAFLFGLGYWKPKPEPEPAAEAGPAGEPETAAEKENGTPQILPVDDGEEAVDKKTFLNKVKRIYFDAVFFAFIIICIAQVPSSCFYLYRYMHVINPVVCLLCGYLLMITCIDRNGKKPIKDIIKENIPILLCLIFIVLVIISTLVTCPGSITFITKSNNFEGTFTHLSYVVWFFMGIALCSEKLRTWVVRIFIISSAVFTLLYLQKALRIGEPLHVISVFRNSNHIGYYLTICIMAAALWSVYGKNIAEKIGSLIVFSLGVYALIINNTLGCQIAAAMGLIFALFVILLCRGKACLKMLVPIGLAVLIFAVSLAAPVNGSSASDGNAKGNAVEIVNDISALSTGFADADDRLGSGRMLLWKDGINKIKEKPLLGWGGENAGNLVYGNGNSGIRVHNEYLQYAIDFGIPAAVIYVLAILAVFIRGLRHRKELSDLNIVALCAAFAYFVSAFFGIRLNHFVPFVAFLFGMGYWKTKTCPGIQAKSGTCDETSAENNEAVPGKILSE